MEAHDFLMIFVVPDEWLSSACLQELITQTIIVNVYLMSFYTPEIVSDNSKRSRRVPLMEITS